MSLGKLMLWVMGMLKSMFGLSPGTGGSGGSMTLAGPILNGSGSVAAPSYSFSADPATGIYMIAPTVGALSSGGTLSAYWAGITFVVRGPLIIGGAVAEDTFLNRDGSGIIGLHNLANPQAFRVYNTFTDASNGEWAEIVWSGNVATLQTNKNGTGVLRSLGLGPVGAYQSVVTAGWGLPAIYAAGRFTGQIAAKASVATYTVGAADGTFEVSANVNVTTSTTHSFSVQVTYTDENNTSRTLVMPMAQLAGSFVASGLITNVTGVGPYESPVMHIRCKAATAITFATVGTFTAVVYNVEGIIKQMA